MTFVLNDEIVNVAPLDGTVFPEPKSHCYAVQVQDTAQALSYILALRDAGAGVFPIHPDIPRCQAQGMAAQAGCDLLLTEDGVASISEASHHIGGGVLVQMSSGTTGAPKVITRRWESIQLEIETYARTFDTAAHMTPVIACPITHSYGLIAGVMVGLQRGRVPVILNSINPKFILRRLAEVQNPLLYSSPAMLHMLASFLPDNHSIHAAMTSGTVLSQPWFEKIRGKTDHLFQQYGCSEIGCIAINPDLQDPSEMGIPLPHLSVSAGIDDPGPIMVNGVATGDLGQFRSDGMLRFISRQDDVIDVAGLNVYPNEIEEVAMTMTGVNDAIVFRIDDALAGQRVGLVFDGPAQSEALRGWLTHRLAPYQVPTEIHTVPRIPRQENGKINRRDVARKFAEAAQ
ncbi:MAG: AMP-binding protein [Pseudomonadota bacterium]